MSDVATIFAEEKVAWKEHEYPMKPLSIKSRGLYSFYLGEKAVQFVVSHKAAYGDVYLSTLKAVSEKGSWTFQWGSETWTDSLANDENLQELALLCIVQSTPSFKRDTLLAMWDDPSGKLDDGTIGTMGQEIAQKLMRLIFRPNSYGPVAVPGESSPTTK